MDNFLNTLRGLGVGRLLMIGIVTAGLIAFFAFLIMRVSQPSMGLLYGDLNIQEASAIASQLDSMNMPYRLAGDGTQILVPEDQVLSARMALAQEGLPSGGSIGYELFDRGDSFGTTSFVQNLNRTRALEGELARSIRTINGVTNARVHLVLSRRGVFENQSQPATASIVLRLTRTLDRQQVRAIQNLVAAAVPDLIVSSVAIVDDKGELLASGTDDVAAGTAVTESEDARRVYEERLRRAIESLLERSVGAGNVRAEVNADMDFDRITLNTESYDPDGQVARSTQSVSEVESSTQAQSQAVTVATNLPTADDEGGGGSGQNRQQLDRTEETTNFEITRTITTQVKEAGRVRRLAVAVLVNHVPVTGADGAVTLQPRPAAELQQLQQLVRTTMGYDEQRGDELQVVSLPFTVTDPLELPPPEDAFMGMSRSELFRVGEIAILAILGLLAILFVARPIVNRVVRGVPAAGALAGSRAAGRLTGPDVIAAHARGDGGDLPLGADLAQLGRPRSGIEEMIDIARIEGQVKASSLSKIGEIVERNPNEAVAIMRNWLYQGG